MIVDQLRSCIGSPEMKESEDPSPVGLALYVGTESEKKSQMRKCGQSIDDLGRPSPYKPGRRVMTGDQCHARRWVG